MAEKSCPPVVWSRTEAMTSASTTTSPAIATVAVRGAVVVVVGGGGAGAGSVVVVVVCAGESVVDTITVAGTVRVTPEELAKLS